MPYRLTINIIGLRVKYEAHHYTIFTSHLSHIPHTPCCFNILAVTQSSAVSFQSTIVPRGARKCWRRKINALNVHGGAALLGLRLALYRYCGPGQSGRYGDTLRAGWSGDRLPMGRDFLHPSRRILWPTQRPVQWVKGLFPRGKVVREWC
jgi:hypothetical protein